MNQTVRKTFLQLHRWAGMTIGLVIVWIAVTGASMAFRPQVEPVVRKDLFAVGACEQRASLDTLAQNARAAHPEGKLGFVRLFGDPRQPTRVNFTDKEAVYLDPCTGAVLGRQGRFSGPFGTLEKLHSFEFMENPHLINGSAALAFAVLIVMGGIALWWPRRLAAVKPSLRFDTRLEGRKGTLNKHKVIGIYAALIVLLSALTALPQSFGWYKDGLYWITGSAKPAPKPKSGVQAGARPLPMEAHWQQLRSMVPSAQQALLHYPKKPGDAVETFVIPSDALHANARTYVYFDAYSGKVLSVRPYAESGLGTQLYFWCLSLHHGEFLGVFGQLLMFLGAISIPFLAYTGISSYLRRRPNEVKPATLRVRVDKVRTEAADIKSFDLVSADGRALPPFSPGAHVSVRIAPDLVRQYSLCNDSTEAGRYRIAVKRVPDSRGGSQAMHEQVSQGDVLTIDPPRNHFPLEPRARHHLLLAGGIGITPLLAMARHLARSGASFELHYFTRSIEQTAFHAELSQPPFAGKVTFHYAAEPGRVDEYIHKLLWHRPDGAHLYLCGPAPFMALAKSKAATWPPEAVHIEYFNADPSASAGPRGEFEVSLALSGGTYKVPADKSVLQVLSEQGVPVAKSCEQGLCGTCLTGVLDGVPDHRDAFLSDVERKSCQKMLLCVSRAKTPRLVLDM